MLGSSGTFLPQISTFPAEISFSALQHPNIVTISLCRIRSALHYNIIFTSRCLPALARLRFASAKTKEMRCVVETPITETTTKTSLSARKTTNLFLASTNNFHLSSQRVVRKVPATATMVAVAVTAMAEAGMVGLECLNQDNSQRIVLCCQARESLHLSRWKA